MLAALRSVLLKRVPITKGFTEVDSITAWGGTGYVPRFIAATPSLKITNLATVGQGLADAVGRKGIVAASGRGTYYSILTGANDLTNSGLYPTAQDYYNTMVGLSLHLRAAGVKVIFCTVLPQSGATTHNTLAVALNLLMAAGVGRDFDVLVDWRRSQQWQVANVYNGAVNGNLAAGDTTKYGDGLHPTDGTGTPTSDGQLVMLRNYTGAVNQLRGLPNQVQQFAFTDASNVTAGATSTSNGILIEKLGYGETKPYAVTGGEVRKTPWGGAAGSWGSTGGTVENGDVLEVRGTASATPTATVDVALTVGAVADTYSITTAASVPLTTTYRNSDDQVASSSTATFTSKSYFAGKNLVWAMGISASVPSSVTVGGTTSGAAVASVLTGNKFIALYEVTKGSGGSGNVVINGASAIAQVGYALYSTDATATFVSSQQLTYNYYNDPQVTPSITMPSGGSILAALQSESSGSTIVPDTGTTEDAEFGATATWKFWVGQRATTGQPSVTGLVFSGSQMLAVSYQP